MSTLMRVWLGRPARRGASSVGRPSRCRRAFASRMPSQSARVLLRLALAGPQAADGLADGKLVGRAAAFPRAYEDRAS